MLLIVATTVLGRRNLSLRVALMADYFGFFPPAHSANHYTVVACAVVKVVRRPFAFSWVQCQLAPA